MKRVFASFDRIAAFHARNLLENEGIASTIRNEFLSSAMGELPPAECQVEIWVSARDAARAEGILRRPRPSGPDWICRCGERLGAQFTQCWKCGEFRRSAPA
ncbi:MAG: DUF2007 domain-containing protein [Pseudomonadota bacterium]